MLVQFFHIVLIHTKTINLELINSICLVVFTLKKNIYHSLLQSRITQAKGQEKALNPSLTFCTILEEAQRNL